MTNAFVGPRGQEQARRLVDAAEELGLDPQSVLTTNGGYLVPVEIVDHLDAKEAEAEKAEAQKVADAAAALAAKKEAEAKAEAEKAAADKAEADKTNARAPRAKRNTKASDAGEEKN